MNNFNFIFYKKNKKNMKKTIQCHSTKTSDLLKMPKKNGNYIKIKSISDVHNYNAKNKILKNQNEILKSNNDKKKHFLLDNNILKPLKKKYKQNPLLSSLYNKNKNNIQIQKNLKTYINQNKKDNLYNKKKKNYPKVFIEIEHKFSMKNNSYAKTAASTGNNNPNENNNDNNNNYINKKKFNNNEYDLIFKNLINKINIRDIESISKIESLKNNIFLIKIYSFISNLISKNYKPVELENNLELKNQFYNLENKLNIISKSKRAKINIINADLFDEINNYNNNRNNSILHESNNRKLIYKSFFDFFNIMLNDIVKLSNELQIQNNSLENKKSLKKIDDLTSKISSLHSKINLSKNYNIDNLDSPVFSSLSLKNNINDDEKNNLYGIEKEGSQLISSFESDFYQQIIKKTFSKDSSNSNQNKIKKIYINNNNKKNDNKIKNENSSKIIQNDDFSDTDIIINDSEFGTINSKSFSSKISRRSISNKQSKKSIKKKLFDKEQNSKRSESSEIRNSIRNIKILNFPINKLSSQIKSKISQKPILKKKIINPNIKEKNNDKCNIF